MRGAWVLTAEGKPIPPGPFKRGLQPSGLAFRQGELWSIGDQRGEHPGQLLRIDPRSGRLIGPPIPLELPAPQAGESPELEIYRSIPNSDFEGLALDPTDSARFLAVTEDKTPWIADIRLAGDGTAASPYRARIGRLTRFDVPGGVTPWRSNPNYAVEGIAIADDGKTVYLAYERAQDELPRVYQLALSAAVSGTRAALEEIPLPFAALPRRADKEKARLNLNDIQFLRRGGRPCLLAVLRDQERLLLIDLERKECAAAVDLDLTDPTGTAIEWVSPEGLALDETSGRVWVINDPDSVDGNFRARGEPKATGPFADYTALLFELRLADVLGAPPASPAGR